jgi:hypothetical protein
VFAEAIKRVCWHFLRQKFGFINVRLMSLFAIPQYLIRWIYLERERWIKIEAWRRRTIDSDIVSGARKKQLRRVSPIGEA